MGTDPVGNIEKIQEWGDTSQPHMGENAEVGVL